MRPFNSCFTLFTILGFYLLYAVFCPFAQATDYKDAVKQWHSYEDVAKWMQENFTFVAYNKRMTSGVQTPEETFMVKRGYCKDGAIFAVDALNRINPEYDAKVLELLDIHYVALFKMNNKLYLMDFAQGGLFASIRGVHVPFDSIKELAEYLRKNGINSSLYIHGQKVY